MDSKDAIFTSDTQIVRSPPMELGSPSMWPDHMVGQPEKPVRVLLIDDDAHLRMVIAQEIMNDRRTMVVGQAGNLKDARKAIRQNDFDVMLLDLNLGDGDGLELIDVMKSQHPHAEAIVVSVMETEEQVLRAFELGRNRLLGQKFMVWQLPSGCAAGCHGGASITPSLARRLLLKRYDKASFRSAVSLSTTDRLSSRESEVLRMVAGGYTRLKLVYSCKSAL